MGEETEDRRAKDGQAPEAAGACDAADACGAAGGPVQPDAPGASHAARQGGQPRPAAGQVPPPQGSPVYAAPCGQPSPAHAPVPGPVPGPSPRPPKRVGKGHVVAIVAIVAFCVVFLASVASCTSMASTSMGRLGLAEVSDAVHDGKPKVGVVSIDGAIQYDGTSCSPGGLRTLLDQAEEDPDVKAVVLRVNSGGGVATAGEEMAHYVKEFSKPVVVSSAATCASAAYEISSQADYIFTSKTTAIGSIGVAMQVTDLSGLYQKLGIDVDNITSAEGKDSSFGNRPLTEEERAWYQDLVDQINADFIEVVAEGREMDVSQVQSLANGLTYTGFDAVENGLADEIGYLEDAVSKASELAGYDKPLDASPLTLSQGGDLLSLLDLLGALGKAQASDAGAGSSAGAQEPDGAALAALAEKYGASPTIG